MAFIYPSFRQYLDDSADHLEKIERVKAIIEALEDAALAAASGQDIQSYSLDDGQTKISNVYRSAKEIAEAIDAFEKILQRHINRCDGRIARLVDFETNIGNVG